MVVVYLHGLNSSCRSFGYVRQNLPEHDAVFINYQSHQPLWQSIATIEAALPKKKELAIVGHSLGGVIGSLIAQRNPLVKKLAVISAPIGGSKAAKFIRWIPNHPAVIDDLAQDSIFIKAASGIKLDIPALSIISASGHLQMPASFELNDSVVTISSQLALPYGRKVEVKANHFEVLLIDETVKELESFLFKETK